MSQFRETKVLSNSTAGISEASVLLNSGELVAFPTETVYGLGADARNSSAVAKIFEAKQRPSFNPLIVHVQDLSEVERLVEMPVQLAKLAEQFWPGPLTLVAPLRANSDISDLVTSGLDTLAVRVPDHPLALELLKTFDGPIAAPSANPSGRVSPTNADHVLEGLGSRIAAVLDGGPCPVGLESTILGMQNGDVTLLRAGGLSMEQILSVTPAKKPSRKTNAVSAPGQLASHYATSASIRLNAITPNENEVYLAFGNMQPDWTGLDLSPAKCVIEAATNLFSHLRRLDSLANELRVSSIGVAPIPTIGLGLAINDRLERAAAPRDT